MTTWDKRPKKKKRKMHNHFWGCKELQSYISGGMEILWGEWTAEWNQTIILDKGLLTVVEKNDKEKEKHFYCRERFPLPTGICGQSNGYRHRKITWVTLVQIPDYYVTFTFILMFLSKVWNFPQPIV